MPIAITYDRFGGPDVLTVSKVGPPQPAEDQVLIEVRAAGVNLVDVKLRRGDLAHVFEPHFPVTPGIEVAGVVTSVGARVARFAPGDNVFGVADAGGYAQFALATHLVHKPETVSWELAAALPTVGEAAFRTLGHLDVRQGETLLIHGAGGNVGAIATQLAVARGITVIGTDRDDKLDLVRRFGAVAIAAGDGLVARVRALYPDGIDAVLDTTGAGVLPDSIDLTGGPERVITIADESAQRYGVRFTGSDPTDRDRSALAQLAQLADSGRLELPIWRCYPLTEAAAAHADLEARRSRGKVVLHP